MRLEEPSAKVHQLLGNLKDESIVATAFFDARNKERKGWVWLLAVLQDYPKLISYLFEKDLSSNIFMIMVDRKLFEKDVKQAFLGELVAERLVLPYTSVKGYQYLKERDLQFKKKIILGSIRNLILEFHGLSKELDIKPEYFPLDYVGRRAKIYKPSKILYENLSKPDMKLTFLNLITQGFTPAIDNLITDEVLVKKGDAIKICDSFIEKSLKKESFSPEFIEILHKSARAVLTEGLARLTSPLQNLKEFSTKLETIVLEEDIRLPDPRKYISFDVKLKIANVTIEKAIQLLVKSFRPWARLSLPIRIKKIGEILNTVFLIEVDSAEGHKKIIVKSFDNWIGLKWFPLSLWAVGLRKFSRVGRKRLANEFFMNDLLKKHGFSVPEIYCLDWDRCLLLEEYIDGINVDTVIRRVARSCQATLAEEELIERVGKLLGDLHKKGFTLGDCKPENLILSPNGHIYIVDLEQSSKAADWAWDVAVFLYFAGRYAIKKQGIHIIVRDFIKGYTSIASSCNILEATKIPYINLFTPVTPLHIITEITKTCNEEISKGSF